MRGRFQDQGGFFSYIRPEERIPADHPLREIRKLVRASQVNQALTTRGGPTAEAVEATRRACPRTARARLVSPAQASLPRSWPTPELRIPNAGCARTAWLGMSAWNTAA
jgi:hypothetical protein